METSADYSEDCCSFETIVKGVMFYPGVKKLNPAVLSSVLSRVKFVRDKGNLVHKKAVFVKSISGDEILGHLTRPVTEAASVILEIAGAEMLG